MTNTFFAFSENSLFETKTHLIFMLFLILKGNILRHVYHFLFLLVYLVALCIEK